MSWTITELYAQPDKKVQKFLQIMKIEAQAENKRKQ
jgi:hypothetical protein